MTAQPFRQWIDIITEADATDPEDLEELAECCMRWIEMSHYPDDIEYILAHPFAQRFRRPPPGVKEIYRSLFYPYEKFQVRGQARARGQSEGFISYSHNPNWGSSIRDDFQYDGDILRFRKRLDPSAVLMDFSALVDGLAEAGANVGGPDESELWISITPYYTRFDRSEFISVDFGISSKTWRKIDRMAAAAARDPSQTDKDVPQELQQLGVGSKDGIEEWQRQFLWHRSLMKNSK